MAKKHEATMHHKMTGPYKKVYMQGLQVWHVLGTIDEAYDTIAAEVTVEDIADLLVQELENQGRQPPLPVLTPEMRQKYLENPTWCPFCQAAEYECFDYDSDIDNKTVRMQSTCGSCGKSWVDIYTLTDVKPMR